jgi:two-component system, NarL family, response regulator NreC
MSTTVVLADDHALVRAGVKMLLEREKLEVVGEASDGFEAIALADQLRPDVVVIDVAMPMLNGLSAVDEIRKVSPRSKMVLLTMYTDEHYVLQALRAGVKGCVSKAQAAEHLLQAIAEVCAGGVYLSPSVSGAVVQAYLSKDELPRNPLSSRERQVLQLVAEGKTTKEIAVILSITVKTAESHRSKLMEKLDIHSTAGLVRYAIRCGFVVA